VDLTAYLDDVSSARTDTKLPLQKVAGEVHFPVLATADMPGGYRYEGCCLGKGGVCNMVACKYRRGQDALVMVQSRQGQSVCYGNRQVVCASVCGRDASIMQCCDRLAVSWPTHGTVVTLIGPKDLSEVVHLINFVENNWPKGNPGH
jgi:hypothetical protein